MQKKNSETNLTKKHLFKKNTPEISSKTTPVDLMFNIDRL